MYLFILVACKGTCLLSVLSVCVWVCVCVVVVGVEEGWVGMLGECFRVGWGLEYVCWKYPGFEVLYFSFLYNYNIALTLSHFGSCLILYDILLKFLSHGNWCASFGLLWLCCPIHCSLSFLLVFFSFFFFSIFINLYLGLVEVGERTYINGPPNPPLNLPAHLCSITYITMYCKARKMEKILIRSRRTFMMGWLQLRG